MFHIARLIEEISLKHHLNPALPTGVPDTRHIGKDRILSMGHFLPSFCCIPIFEAILKEHTCIKAFES